MFLSSDVVSNPVKKIKKGLKFQIKKSSGQYILLRRMTPSLPALSSVSLVRHHVAVLAPMTFLRADSVIFRKGRIQTFTPSSPFTC